jgi:hypothetical protein
MDKTFWNRLQTTLLSTARNLERRADIAEENAAFDLEAGRRRDAAREQSRAAEHRSAALRARESAARIHRLDHHAPGRRNGSGAKSRARQH